MVVRTGGVLFSVVRAFFCSFCGAFRRLFRPGNVHDSNGKQEEGKNARSLARSPNKPTTKNKTQKINKNGNTQLHRRPPDPALPHHVLGRHARQAVGLGPRLQLRAGAPRVFVFFSLSQQQEDVFFRFLWFFVLSGRVVSFGETQDGKSSRAPQWADQIRRERIRPCRVANPTQKKTRRQRRRRKHTKKTKLKKNRCSRGTHTTSCRSRSTPRTRPRSRRPRSTARSRSGRSGR